MHPLLKTLQKVSAGELTNSEASEQLGIPTVAVGKLASSWGPTAEDTSPLFDELRVPQQSASERASIIRRIADLTGHTPRATRNFAVRVGAIRVTPLSEVRRIETSKSAAERKKRLYELALRVIAGHVTPAQDRETEGFPYDTILVNVRRLLKPQGLSYRDLRHMPTPKREAISKLADHGQAFEPKYPPRR